MTTDTTKTELIEQLKSIECQLSPEKLTRDGKLPQSEVNRRAAHLNRQRSQIIKQLGYQPTDKELWGF
jgi:hypothetical protein